MLDKIKNFFNYIITTPRVLYNQVWHKKQDVVSQTKLNITIKDTRTDDISNRQVYRSLFKKNHINDVMLFSRAY